MNMQTKRNGPLHRIFNRSCVQGRHRGFSISRFIPITIQKASPGTFIGDSMGINGAFYTAASVLYAYLVAKAFRRQSRGENTSRRHPGCALNWSFKSLHTAVPSSPGAYEMLNCDTSSATTLRTSLRASCFPMQLCLPVYGLVSPMS